AFKEQASNRSVIHLALHSFLHDEKPLFSQLVFSGADSTLENVITANELYAMELNAELVVLSACESGIGQLNRGEGMMSLSRAFMYAGVIDGDQSMEGAGPGYFVADDFLLPS